MDSIIAAFIGFAGAVIGSGISVFFSQREWRKRRKSDAYAEFFKLTIQNVMAPSYEDIIAYRTAAILVSLYTNINTGKKFAEVATAISNGEYADDRNELLEKLTTLYEIASKDIR